MTHDAPPLIYLIGIGIPAVATIVVACISSRGGKKAADSDVLPNDHSESGEHAHTRDLLREGIKGLHRRFDTIERTQGAVRKSEQLGVSAKRLEERGK